MAKSMIRKFIFTLILFSLFTPFLWGQEDDSKAPSEKAEPSTRGEKDLEENGSLPLEALSSSDKKKRFGRTLAPDVLVEMDFFFAEFQSKSKFGANEEKINLHDNMGLSQFSTVGGAKLFLLFESGKLSMELFRSTSRGKSLGPTRNLSAGGQPFNTTDPIESSQKLNRVGFSLFYSMVPRFVQGLKFNIFLNFQYVMVEEKISNSTGSVAETSFGTLIPNFGFDMELALLYSNPSNMKQVLQPRPYLSLFFQVQGVGFLDYSSRRVLHYYELEVGTKIKPADFFEIGLSFRIWSFEVKETEGKKQVQIYAEGIYLSFVLKF